MNLDNRQRSLLAQTPATVEGSSPAHQTSMSSSFDFLKRGQIDFTYRYVSSLPGLSVPSYSTGDARIAWRFLPQLELSVIGRNLFQPYHIEDVYEPGPPIAIKRSVYATLAFHSR